MAARVAWVAARVSKENVSPDQPRSSPLASAFDATAEIFTTFDLVFRRDSARPLIGGPWPRPAHVRVTRSPEHYQPLYMPDASTLMCRYAPVHMCAFLSPMYICEREDMGRGRAADSTTTYASTYDRYIGIGMCIPGGVPFGEAAVGFRYDTVD